MSSYAHLLETEASKQWFNHLLKLTHQRKWAEFRRFCRQIRKDYEGNWVLRLEYCLFEELRQDVDACGWLCDVTAPRKSKNNELQKQAFLDDWCHKSA